MDNRKVIKGMVILGTGLLASSMSSFLEQSAILGTATNFTRGPLNELSVVTFCVAIFVLVRRRGVTRE